MSRRGSSRVVELEAVTRAPGSGEVGWGGHPRLHARVPILQDHDVAIWCCPNGDIYQIIEFKVGDPEPVRKFCSKCGARYVNRCPNKSCPHPTFHPSDAVANVHGPCGAKIPWAEARNSAVIVGPGFQSKLIGTGSYMGKSSLAPDSVTDIDHDNRDPPHRRIPTAEPVDVTRDLDVVVPRSRKPVITEIYRSKELRAAEPPT